MKKNNLQQLGKWSLYIGLPLLFIGASYALVNDKESRSHLFSALFGASLGMGAILTAYGCVYRFNLRFRPHKIKEQEIRAKDEREIRINEQTAALVSLLLEVGMIVGALFAVTVGDQRMYFVLMGLMLIDFLGKIVIKTYLEKHN
ncbi:MAG: hypothetical protein LBR25_00750 [Erysipelotrichaceae bacterium]|jgi:hypothetical protein|nr:hypothetical protein [Erysipelotrichaceae bacterium]